MACQSGGGGSNNSTQCTQPTARYIVKLKAKSLGLAIANRFESFSKKFSYLNRVTPIGENLATVEFNNMEEINKRVLELTLSGEIEYAEPDVKAYALSAPNDPLYGSQWAHQKVQSSKAFDISTGSQSVVVAMIDSGVDYTHPDIAPNMWINTKEVAGNGVDDDRNGYVDDIYGYDFANNDSNPMDDDGHGTHTAGTVGARGGNGKGISGHSPIVKIMALKFLAKSGAGDVSAAVRAIDYAVKNGAKIMNNSWGSNVTSRTLSDAIIRARNAGVLFVAAAGNSAENNDVSPSYPANYPYDNVISVAASTSGDTLAEFSSYGATKVHIAAPGQGILSTLPGATYGSADGTSMAAPLVSGVLALMIARRPDLNYLQIRQALLSNVDTLSSLSGKVSTGGRINAYKALNAIATGTNPKPTPVPSTPPEPQSPQACL